MEQSLYVPKNELEDSIMDDSQLENTDIKINPSYYIHIGLLKMQDCLLKDNARDGFLQYQTVIRYLETICKASGIIKAEYDAELKLFVVTDEYTKEPDRDKKSMILHEKKLLLILTSIFSNKTLTSSLRYGFKMQKPLDEGKALP